MKEIWWAKKNSDGTYTVDTSKLLFSLILDELAIVEALHNVDEKGRITSRENLIKIWKAETMNLRKIPIMTVVRASYHLFYKPVMHACIILVCFEKDYLHCHRRLLATEISKRHPETSYRGELLLNKKTRNEVS